MSNDPMFQLLRDNAGLQKRVVRLESWETGDGLIFLPVPHRDNTPQPFPQATQNFSANIPLRGGVGVAVRGLSISFYPVTVSQSSTNYYTATASAVATGSVYTALTLTGTTTTKTFVTTGKWYEMPITVTSGTLSNTTFHLVLLLTMSGSPGTFYAFATLYYKKIG